MSLVQIVVTSVPQCAESIALALEHSQLFRGYSRSVYRKVVLPFPNDFAERMKKSKKYSKK